MAVIELTKETFESTVTQNPMVIVDFWAPWCGPCRSFAPTYEEVSGRYPNLVFAKVNTEEQTELAGYFKIRSIPTLMVLREKVILYSEPGALSAGALEQLVNAVQEMDMAVVHQEMAKPPGGASA